MKIIEYDNQIKDLLCELQNHIVKIDIEKFNVINDDFRDKYFEFTMESVFTNITAIMQELLRL